MLVFFSESKYPFSGLLYWLKYVEDITVTVVLNIFFDRFQKVVTDAVHKVLPNSQVQRVCSIFPETESKSTTAVVELAKGIKRLFII